MSHHLSESELQVGLESVKVSPKDQGAVEMIVIRPRNRERLVLTECEVSAALGVHGDMWADGCWKKLPDGSPHPDVQITLMNSRCIALLAGDKNRWSLAGDQFFVDLDLSMDNLPVGQQLSIGTAILQITDIAHTGCEQFIERYGKAAKAWVNSPLGKQMRLRGIYARVIQAGFIKTGDAIAKI